MFTGRHHVNFSWLCNISNVLENYAYTNITLGYSFYKNPDDCKENTKELNFTYNGHTYTAKLDNDGILIISSEDTGNTVKYNLQKHVGNKFTITGISYRGTITIVDDSFRGSPLLCTKVNRPTITYHCHMGEVTETNYGFMHHRIIICDSTFFEYLYKGFNWFWYNVVDRICIIPGYTELDAMPDGWRKKFGIQICKDIKHSLLHTYLRDNDEKNIFKKLSLYWKGVRLLYNYRIEQIKEKFASLRWYDYNTTDDVQKIIDHYEDISMKTCIVCGKPATYMSKGWICPYCDDHIGDKEYATRIENT